MLYIALALSLPPVFVALYVFLPEVYIELVGFFLPDEQYRIPDRIGRKEYKLPLFFRSRAHKDRGDGVFPALILCGLPVEKPVEHLKIFPDRLGVFPTCDLFYRGHFSLLLREGAYTTYELEDDMKGWMWNIKSSAGTAWSVFSFCHIGNLPRFPKDCREIMNQFLLRFPKNF